MHTTEATPQRTSRRPTARLNPLQREMSAGRVSGELDLARHMFEREFNTAYWSSGGTAYVPDQTPTDALIGAEHTANSALFCRYLGFRIGSDLFGAMVDAIISDFTMAELAYPLDASASQTAKSASGRARIVAALTLTSSVWEDWMDLEAGDRASRGSYGLGEVSALMSPDLLELSVEMAKRRGNHVFGAYQRRASALREFTSNAPVVPQLLSSTIRMPSAIQITPSVTPAPLLH